MLITIFLNMADCKNILYVSTLNVHKLETIRHLFITSVESSAARF